MKHFRQNILAHESDIVVATESWLSESVEDSELVGETWSILRRDRATGRQGGGVLVAARPGIHLRRRCELETADCEDLWTSVVVNDCLLHLCAVYIPPNSSDNVYLSFFRKVESFIDSLGMVLILGDLNLNPKYTPISILSYYCYFTTVCDLVETNEMENMHGGVLDVVLVRERIQGVVVSKIDDGGLVPHPDSYHPPLDIFIPLANAKSRFDLIDPSNVDFNRDWNFANGNYELLYHLFSEVSWQGVIDTGDVHVAVSNFYEIVYGIFDTCIPRKRRPSKPCRRYPVWFNADLISDIKQKAFYHREWKRSGDRGLYGSFSKLRADIKLRISEAYDSYIKRVQARITYDPRAFWQHVSSLKSKGGFVNQVLHNGEQREGVEAAQAFADFFSSVFLPDVPVLDYTETMQKETAKTANYVEIVKISSNDVEVGISRLKPQSSPGPDCLPAYILKGCKDWLLLPLAHIFNLVLNTGVYPNQWKVTRVRPIPKSGNADNVENYRPIAILSSIAKLFESIINKLLAPQVKPFLNDSQHGFRPRRSVESNLLTLVDCISEHLDKGIQVDVLYFDFKKAFDRVDNDILLSKLCNIGFSPRLLRFFASYLRDRQQYVQHGCFVSDSYHTRSGVSQGSILGPFLFGIMVNDLASVPKHAKCLLYADDLKLVYGIQELSDSQSLQEDVTSIYNWSKENKLLFNTGKCSVMSFSRSHSPLSAVYVLGTDPIVRVETVRDLGVIFDGSLNFHAHMKNLVSNCYRKLGFVIRNTRDFDNPGVIKLVYTALVRSKLEAACIVWNPRETTYVLVLEKIQKAFLRFLYKKMYGYYPFLYPTKFLLGTLGFNSLEVRRNFALLTCACRTLRGDSDCLDLVMQLVRLFVPPLSQSRFNFRPRTRPLLAVPEARTVSHRHSPLLRALQYLNALLAAAPDCDIFASSWSIVSEECMRLCETMDDRPSSV